MPTLLVGANLVDREAPTPSYRRCGRPEGGPMSDALLRDIAQYCRGAGIAESTFGRLAVNDGKLVSRLRLGGRLTTETAERVRAFIARQAYPQVEAAPNGSAGAPPLSLSAPIIADGRNFRFY